MNEKDVTILFNLLDNIGNLLEEINNKIKQRKGKTFLYYHQEGNMEQILRKVIEEYRDNINIDVTADYESYADYNSSNYISDSLMECADGSVDIYYCNLIEWCKDNWEFVEDAIEEYGDVARDGRRPDFIRTIQQGQFYCYERELYDNLDDIIKKVTCDCLIDLLENTQTQKTEQDFDEFIESLNIDHNDRWDDILDACKEFLEVDEDVEQRRNETRSLKGYERT